MLNFSCNKAAYGINKMRQQAGSIKALK